MITDVRAQLTGRIHHTSKKALGHRGVIRQISAYKPHGLWYSVDSEWWDWCTGESFDAIESKRAFRLDLDTSDFLVISTLAAIDQFTEEYATVPLYPGADMKQVDWVRVAAKYKGMEIAPYLHARRFDVDFMWYYGWDVASGCLWDYSAFRGAKLIYEPEVVA